MLLTARAAVRAAAAPPAVLQWLPALVGDAAVVSDRLVREPLFVSAAAHHDSFTVRSFNGGAEELTRDVPRATPQELGRLDARGLIRIGGTVREGEVLAGKVRAKPAQAPEEKLVVTIFGPAGNDVVDLSLRYPYRDPGVVIGVHLAARWQGFAPRKRLAPRFKILHHGTGYAARHVPGRSRVCQEALPFSV